MAGKKRYSRSILTVAASLAVAGILLAAFWPRPMLVDLATVKRGDMIVTINEEGRTRVKEPYVVSSPVAGELQRVTVLPGDRVVGGETIVARMSPANPSALDVRTREQAIAAAKAKIEQKSAQLEAKAKKAERDANAKAERDRLKRQRQEEKAAKKKLLQEEKQSEMEAELSRIAESAKQAKKRANERNH